MKSITANELAKASEGTIICGDKDAVITDIVTNSREATSGALFIPLIGERSDGHDYITAAIDKGASASLTQRDIPPHGDKTIIKVENTRKALGAIAKYYKSKCNLLTVAVTGSVGKTTTKDMTASVIARGYKTHKTNKNFNNDIGVPLTIFGIEEEHTAAVIEMGMNHFGEIEYLADIVRPDIAIITNIGQSHIENLGSREGIFKAKTEITKYFTAENALIVNGDDDFLPTLKGKTEYKIVMFGISNPECDVKASQIEDLGLDGIRFTAEYNGEKCAVRVKNAGVHNVYNALAAISAGLLCGIPLKDCAEGVYETAFTEGRMETIEKDGIKIINDCYNASPDSIEAALGVLSGIENMRRVAVLGDILEMGGFAADAHYNLGKAAAKDSIDLFITAGENMKHFAKGVRDAGRTNVISFDATDEVCDYVKKEIHKGDAVLIKASHGMNFTRVYDAVINK